MKKSVYRSHDLRVSRKTLTFSVVIFVLLTSVFSIEAAPVYRPKKVQRALNTDQYILSIQKNSQVDIHTTSGLPIVNNAFPAITFAGESPRPLKVDHRQSTRVGINNALGKGNGIHFQTASCEWRIATYPGQPFITVDLSYTNNTKKAVRVEALTPWTIGERGKGAIFIGPAGSGKAEVFQNVASAISPVLRAISPDESMGHVAVQNRTTGDILVAGFISHGVGKRYIRLLEEGGYQAATFKRFSAVCRFNPPILLNPGERLQADTLYLSIREIELSSALHRFALASSRVDPYPRLASAYRHGWYAGAAADLNESTVRATMERLAKKGANLGWAHLHLGKAWMSNATTLAIDQGRFPKGLAPLAAYAHHLGLTLGITVPLLPQAALSTLSDFIAACDEWGLDSIELEYARAAPDGDSAIIQPNQLRDTLLAADYQGRNPVYVRPVMAGASGRLQDWAVASRQFYLPPSGNPLLAAPGTMPLQDGSRFTDGQFVTAFSLAAMQGSNLRPVTPFSEQSQLRRNVLARLVPGYKHSAKPIDLLEEEAPQQWYLPLKTQGGMWTIVGLFNWDETAPKTFRTPLTSFSLNSGVRYTVYDFWAGRYLGMIKDLLQVEVPGEGVRLLGLRYVEQRPMLVASNRHYTQGALDHSKITWSYDTRELSGKFKATRGFPYTLTFHVPKAYALKSVDCSEEISEHIEKDGTLSISFSPTVSGEFRWALKF